MESNDRIKEKVIYNKITSYLNVENKNIQNNDFQLQRNNMNNENDGLMNKYFSEIIQNIGILENNRINTAHRYLGNAKFKVFIKKVIRKALKWYINPICSQQTDFNNAITPIIGRTTELLQHHTLKLYEMDSVINDYHQKIEDLNIKINKISELEERFSSLDKRIDKTFSEELNKNTTLDLINRRIYDMEKNSNYVNNKVLQLTETVNKFNEAGISLTNENSEWIKKTTSQAGEDSIIAYILIALGIPANECSYLDLGANHAKELNNTYYLYSKGARGVLVEANPQLIPELKFYRHEDIILNKCVAPTSNEYLDFYILSGNGLSTPDKSAAEEFISKNPNLSIVDVKQVETISVNDILDTYFGQAPTVLNIDIEGKDLDILNTIDFERYRPFIIVIEMIEYMPRLVYNNKNKDILVFMESRGYIEYAFTGINSIFIDKIKLDSIFGK